MFVLIFWSH